MRVSGRLGVTTCLLAFTALTACTPESGDDVAPRPSDSPPPPTRGTDEATPLEDLRCQQPAASVVETAKLALAAHPGPVRSATVVRAARTSTGTWFVVGIDRAYIHDDGTLAGGASRSLGLTNAPAGDTIIPLGEGTAQQRLRLSWDNVSWTGETLRAGRRAARTVIDCLAGAGAS